MAVSSNDLLIMMPAMVGDDKLNTTGFCVMI
jgi:hypothetical protein